MLGRPLLATEPYNSVRQLLREQRPSQPAYCIFPHSYFASAKSFLAGFPGRVLYAVKANSDLRVLQPLVEAGVEHFDCASLEEIEIVHRVCPQGSKYFMTPVRLRGAAKVAQQEFGVRHFVVDDPSGLASLISEIDVSSSVIFARMAVHHAAAMADLSVRFGAPPEEIIALLTAIGDSGAEPALAFNVGSSVTSPDAYQYAMTLLEKVLSDLPFKLRLIDVGGGYPRSYPGFEVPPLQQYFLTLSEGAKRLALADNAELLGEPGRALAAPGMSAVVEVLLRKEDHLYINDGMHGIFWELRYRGHQGFPVAAYRAGRVLGGATATFRVSGPSCDSADTLPGPVELPADIGPGDYLEFGCIGAYSLSGRTNFNGFFSDRIVTITSPTERPPQSALA